MSQQYVSEDELHPFKVPIAIIRTTAILEKVIPPCNARPKPHKRYPLCKCYSICNFCQKECFIYDLFILKLEADLLNRDFYYCIPKEMRTTICTRCLPKFQEHIENYLNTLPPTIKQPEE